jgi:predicted DNA-binding transcriptional regulator AlpA
MTPQLYSIEHAPAALPIWQTILDDLANPPVRRVARVLGIAERTVYRYNQTGHAPRVVSMALFWLTRWGRSAVHTQATNDAAMACSLVAGLERHVKELTGQLAYLERLGGFGASNAPFVLPVIESGDRGGTPQVVSLQPSGQPAAAIAAEQPTPFASADGPPVNPGGCAP